MPTLYLMRGLPGSGKTTKAKQIAAETGAVIVSADHYFTDGAGVYSFDPRNLKAAHFHCRKLFLKAVSNGHSVIVDNTNSTFRDMDFYLYNAQWMGYTWELVYPGTDWQGDPYQCYKRCTHGVPLPTIVQMLERWE